MMNAKPRTTTAIRFNPDLHARLEAEAERLEVSMNWLVNRAVGYMLDHLDINPASLSPKAAS